MAGLAVTRDQLSPLDVESVLESLHGRVVLCLATVRARGQGPPVWEVTLRVIAEPVYIQGEVSATAIG